MAVASLSALAVCSAALAGGPAGLAPASARSWRRTASQTVNYELAHASDGAVGAPVLLLPGFGAGAFHWRRNLKQLAHGSGSDVFAMDYLGQGGSWPEGAGAGGDSGLGYSIDVWIEQAEEFAREVVLKEGRGHHSRCHVVGNSVGGLIGAHLAVRYPELVESLVLVNPTPVWGSNLPGWDGVLPGPRLAMQTGAFLFDKIRDRSNIVRMLGETYATPETVGDLPDLIRRVTDENAGGHEAFASILWSAPATMPEGASSFEDVLRQVRADVLCVYGAQDPWCKPAFGRAAFRALSSRGSAARQALIELSPAGHCPHHEAPGPFNSLAVNWVRQFARESDVDAAPTEPLKPEELLAGCDGHEPVVAGAPPVSARWINADDNDISLWDRLLTMFVK